MLRVIQACIDISFCSRKIYIQQLFITCKFYLQQVCKNCIYSDHSKLEYSKPRRNKRHAEGV